MAEAPPSYAQATGSTVDGSRPRSRNGIPAQHRRSMEDENRPLPFGWVRQFDPKQLHHFYVDTNAKPPRSTWHHPHDDENYLASLSPEERERLEAETAHPSKADIISMSSTEDFHEKGHEKGGEKDGHSTGSSKAAAASGAAAGAAAGAASSSAGHRNAAQPHAAPKGIKKFGRSLKDKVTGTTHDQREAERRERDIQEQREYEMHQRVRAAMARAMETGQPQLIGKDRNGKDVYIEPPAYGAQGGYGSPGGYGGYYGGGARGYQDGNAYGYNPYQNGPYHNSPNAVYLRPDYPYSRPYGSGYGGGYGLPLLGGLVGGALIGGLLF